MNQTDIYWNKERNLAASIIDGWKLMALNFKSLLRTWGLHLVVAAATQALSIGVFLFYVTEHALPAYRIYSVTHSSDHALYLLSCSPWLLSAMFVSLILLLISAYFCSGRLARIQQHFALRSRVPAKISCRHYRHSGSALCNKHLFTSDMLFVLIALFVTAFISLIAWKINLWILLVLPVAYIYIMCAARTSRMLHTVFGLSFAMSAKLSYGKLWWHGFVVQLLMFFPRTILAVISWLLPATYVLSSLADADTRLMGDESVMPSGITALFFVLSTIAFSFYMFTTSACNWTFALRLQKKLADTRNNDGQSQK